jgi:hypothetical protein
VCVAAPGNPDGLHEYIDLMKRAYPQIHISLIHIPDSIGSNRGKMLNAAFRESTASRIMISDCDVILPPHFVRTIIKSHKEESVLGCWRTPMSPDMTAKILTGAIDPVSSYESLKTQWDQGEITNGVRQGLLGYCQIVSRRVFEKLGYPEDFDGYRQADIVFIDRLRDQLGIVADFRQDLFLLHLSHHRDWTGTKVFL